MQSLTSGQVQESLISLNTIFLDAFVKVFKDTFPIFSAEDVNLAVDLLYQGKWEAILSKLIPHDPQECACFGSLWGCVATGALVQGSEEEAEMFAAKAHIANSMCDVSASLSQQKTAATLCRAQMQLALYYRVSGDQHKAIEHLNIAENVSNKANLEGSIKALKFSILSSKQVIESLDSLFFSDSDLDGFTIDAKYYFKWSVPFFYHIVFEVSTWELSHECYNELLIAEKHLLDQWNKPVRNWSRIQFLLLLLEFGSLQMYEAGARRARELCALVVKQSKILANAKYISGYHNTSVMVLETLAYTFAQVLDFEQFELVRSIWNALPFTKKEMPLQELRNIMWGRLTDDPLRNALRAYFQRVSFQNSMENKQSFQEKQSYFDLEECIGEHCERCLSHQSFLADVDIDLCNILH